MRTKRFAVGAAALGAAVSVSLAGCTPATGGGGGGGAQDDTLTIWSSYGGAQGDAIRSYTEQFEADSGQKVELIEMGTPDLKQRVQAAIVSDSLPDVIQYFGGSQMQPLIDAGALVDIAPLAESDAEWLEGLAPSWSAPYEFNGGIYGVPVESPTVQMFYNTELFAQAGIDEAPATFDELLAAVEALVAADIIPMTVSGKDGWTIQEIFAELTLRNGGANALTEAMAKERPWTDAAFVDAATQLKQLADAGAFQQGFLGESSDQATAYYVNGEAAIWVLGTFVLGTLTGAETDILQNTQVAPFPLTGGTGTLNEVQGGPGASFSVTENAGDSDAAWEYVKGMTGPDMAATVANDANVVVPRAVQLDADAPQILSDLIDDQQSYTTFNAFWDSVLPAAGNTRFLELQSALLAGEISPENMMQQFDDFMANN